ncbi:iron export ABC transporter permease subunit FetB [Phormidesmis priestleyi ULC007]|uniref:Iron export ABC transporter permease subunit FetB n=1 Tax=Phormidesmis priestleyi ULC007 TaxID=1920490 RepID=A0A2T1DM64_9CYAN|nr:iron export ABC transporter permease subunit FetB [Phormidesmis priestleyi]PSB21555.1 iron export ABC transporter permease subunit FetB [Phormidesmis priestleyi ULC007]PZO54595.1 MAG: iron export ABC transporter permease subunit FetB [Phormidesmis priestleyi]
MDLLIRLPWALGLILAAIALSSWQKLGLEGSLALAAGRTIAQLTVVGYFLGVVFAFKSPWAVLAVLGGMLIVASIVARNRISQKIPRLLPLIAGSILVSTALTLTYTSLLIVQPQPWYDPQTVIPLAGIVLGNAMNGAAIAGDRLVSTLNSSQLEIETHLSLGATPQQAVAQYRRDAIKAGLIPTINSMMVVGLVTLPGIITGQLLGGADPIQAAAFQMLILFMLAFATLLTTILVTQGLLRQFFNQAAQLILW